MLMSKLANNHTNALLECSSYNVQVSSSIVNWHVSSIAIVVLVGKELVHEIIETKASRLKNARFSILCPDDIRRYESSC
jgi:tRNA A22 N-methylase